MSKVVVVIGDGPVGRTVAQQSIARGDTVRVLTRSGTGPEGAERRAVDAADPAALRAAMTGVQTVFGCLHPRRYTARAWRRELPVADRVVRAEARRAGAGLVYPESMYAFGPQPGPVGADTPRRPTTALGRIRAGLIADRLGSGQPVAIVVAADFYGPHVRDAHAGERMVRAVTGGQVLRVIGDPDAAHSFTYVPDLAAAMIAAADRADEGGRLLVAPSTTTTQRELAATLAAAAGSDEPVVRGMPTGLLRAAGVVSAQARALASTSYLFDRPAVLAPPADGARPTPITRAAAETIDWWRGNDAQAAAGTGPAGVRGR